jgi:integrase
LLEAGVPITTVSKRLGHSKVSITMDIYSHTTREMEKFAASVFDKKIEVVAHGLHTNG